MLSPATGRESILNEAAELFLSNGYGDTSLRDIAAAVGIQPASIYHHFGSKEALFTEILRIGIEFTTTAFDAASTTTSTALPAALPADRLLAHIEAHLSALFDHRPFTAANIVVFPVAPASVKAAVIPTRDAYEQRWDDLFRSLADSGSLNPQLNVQMARRITLGAINTAIEWFDPDSKTANPLSITDLARTTTDLVWTGIGAQSTP